MISRQSRRSSQRLHPQIRRSFTRRTFTSSYGQIPVASPQVRRIHWKIKFLVFALLAVFVSGRIAWTQHVSAEAAATKHAQQQMARDQVQKAAVFADQVEALVAAHPELSLSVVVAPGADGMQQYGTTNSFDAASTAKLLTAADLLRHVEHGQTTLTTDIDGQTAQSWLKAMIINSDDSAWAELNNYLGHTDLQAYAESIGITDYNSDNNTLTARDITSLLQKLYNRQLLSNVSRSLLLSYLLQANYRDFIVPAVPAGDSVYHKIGMDGDSVHDAAIMTNGTKSFTLTIFTDGHGIYNWDVRKLIMQQITGAAIKAYL